MNREAIYHRPKQNFAYAATDETLHIRIQTKKEDMDSVYIHCKDPYTHTGYVMPMKKTGSDALFDYWQGEVSPPKRRLEYYFELLSGEERAYYTENGCYHHQHEIRGLFRFPYIHKSDRFRAPEWVKETVWYQVFPERFENGDPTLNPPGTLPWGFGEPHGDSYYGGDLRGIINRLSHLEELGVNGLYLTPVFRAGSNHKYDTIDYMEIDPQFGTKEDLKELVERCHERGIRVMLDAVFNHSGFDFPPFQDVLKKGETSEYADWFHIYSYPVTPLPLPNYETFSFTHLMPKLNTENPEVKAYLINAAVYWTKEIGIDGWRLDVANEVDHVFWRAFRQAVKRVNREAYIVGEVWHDPLPWLLGDQFDAAMNYPFTQLALDCFARKTIPVEAFYEGLSSLRHRLPEPVGEVAFTLLGSHDTPRIATECGGDRDALIRLFVLQLTMPGSPCVYYGDEIGMTGGGDPGCRKCMEWCRDCWDEEVYDAVRQLINLRRGHPSLMKGNLTLKRCEGVLLYERCFGEEIIEVALSPSGRIPEAFFRGNILLQGNGWFIRHQHKKIFL